MPPGALISRMMTGTSLRPRHAGGAPSAFPGDQLYRPEGIGRTRSGCSTPCSRIEEASSAGMFIKNFSRLSGVGLYFTQSKLLPGWNPRCCYPRQASSPLPKPPIFGFGILASPLSFGFCNQLPRKLIVGLCSAGGRVII